MMRASGQIAGRVMGEVLSAIKPGIATSELDALAEKLILQAGGSPSFKGVPGWDYATCINVNEGVVHGVPSGKVLREGDVVSVDLGVYYQGFHSDTAWTKIVQSSRPQRQRTVLRGGQAKRKVQSSISKEKFLKVGRDALEKAIAACRVGNRVGDVSAAIQETVEKAGFNVVRDYTGHGIGRELHEPPSVSCLGQPEAGDALAEGMVLAIEVIYTSGNYKLKTLKDGWTAVTEDGKIAGLFEKTVAIHKDGPQVLTNY
ncbi:methionyl aminopeptidase [Candidatus Parcubacteria bacterium]|nr:methionyl aminopeptidase [Candidatus Parcubacteria bacterium]